MRKRNAIILGLVVVAIIGVASTPVFVRHLRERQFLAAKNSVESFGGHLSFDLVDGNYMLDLDGASDDDIESMIDALRGLPTGFTLLGPGEGRQFWITIRDSSITDVGLAMLCDLDVTFLTLGNCPQLTDASASRLSRFDHTYVTISGHVPFSEDALASLDSALGYRLIPRAGDIKGQDPSDVMTEREVRSDNGQSQVDPR